MKQGAVKRNGNTPNPSIHFLPFLLTIMSRTCAGDDGGGWGRGGRELGWGCPHAAVVVAATPPRRPHVFSRSIDFGGKIVKVTKRWELTMLDRYPGGSFGASGLCFKFADSLSTSPTACTCTARKSVKSCDAP